MTASLAATATAAAASSIVARTANSVSMTATIDRSSSSSSNVVASATTTMATTTAATTSPVVLACSPVDTEEWSKKSTNQHSSLQARLETKRKAQTHNRQGPLDADGYPLCQYRKSFFGHLTVKNFITSTIRVTIQQATMVLAAFMSEQMEQDLQRNELVNTGQLTQLEADVTAEAWEKVEWKKRWKMFPMKLATAFTKYHAVTLILRVYEFIAGSIVKVNMVTMDKLTMDPFQKSKRIVDVIKKKNSVPKETVWDHKVYVVSTMTATTFWANLLSFCADYSLHQGLLCYGYYKYYTYQRQRRRLALASADFDFDDADHADENQLSLSMIHDDDKVLAKDLMTKSAPLAANRTLGLVCSAIGGGIGSIVWPGWGTIVVSAIGDNIAGAAIDDGYFKAFEILDSKKAKQEQDD